MPILRYNVDINNEKKNWNLDLNTCCLMLAAKFGAKKYNELAQSNKIKVDHKNKEVKVITT